MKVVQWLGGALILGILSLFLLGIFGSSNEKIIDILGEAVKFIGAALCGTIAGEKLQ